MRELEEKTLPSPHLMSIQTDINWKMRKTLILWLIDVHREYRLRQETLYLTINILDRVCSKRAFARYQFQLLGITSLWVAAKYEENHGKVPSLKALCFVCCDTYRERDFLAMEKVILKEIQFELGHPTPEAFLKANCRFLKSIEEDGRCLARYIMENTLVHRRFLGVRPSLIATASLMLAERILGRNGWFYDDPKLIDCMAQMADCMRQPPNQLFIKYADTSLLSVSRLAQTWTEIHTRPMNPYDPNTGLLTPPKEISLQNLLPFKETKPPTFTLLQASSAPLQPSHITAATGTTGAPPSVSANAAAAAAAAEALSSLHFWDLHAGRGMGQHFSLPSMIRAVWE
ncbi:hypothetical protein HK097_001582 [Rhizophlyctis rosea]|uniref:Cyclin N-terminal domain-containing protein n=1 Tax=Rhizophlyctis rosea TaxID=64517 RepID=A0AAD5S5Z5_9FUNG|nr:hypothetical protein HK097_001582 [Rhizophlyctis rosea]